MWTYRLVGRVKDRVFATLARRSFSAWGERTVVRLPFRVEGEERISLGSLVTVGEGCWFQAIEHGEIVIGDGCQFSGYAVVSAAESIAIEPEVLVARNVHVIDHLHRFDLVGLPVLAQGLAAHGAVRIGRGAWIGTGAVILPGVTIGRNAVVGANSVVRSDVPDCAVAAGAPAKVIRYLRVNRDGRGAPTAPAAN
jgi:acetyltransferase-like isoleucine patch superfamily enzyme